MSKRYPTTNDQNINVFGSTAHEQITDISAHYISFNTGGFGNLTE
jgi:hypothetical protein